MTAWELARARQREGLGAPPALQADTGREELGRGLSSVSDVSRNAAEVSVRKAPLVAFPSLTEAAAVVRTVGLGPGARDSGGRTEIQSCSGLGLVYFHYSG